MPENIKYSLLKKIGISSQFCSKIIGVGCKNRKVEIIDTI